MAHGTANANWTAKVYKNIIAKTSGEKLTRKTASKLLVAIAINDVGSKPNVPFDVSDVVPDWHLLKAHQNGEAIIQQSYRNKPGYFYSLIEMPSALQNRNLFVELYHKNPEDIKEFPTHDSVLPTPTPVSQSAPDVGNASVLNLVTTETEKNVSDASGFATHGDTLSYIHSSYSKKPQALVMNEVYWKYLVRSVIRGRNVLMTGPSGTGKTLSAMSVAKAVNRPFFYFNLGATQDPRSSLIGNTHLNKDTGTYFAESPFIKAIRTPDAIILLDEISRAHPDSWNILMTVLDLNQRYLRLDEKEDSELVKVADGVSFIATANIGAEYTATRVIDKALYERFGSIIEMPYLSIDDEVFLLGLLYPSVSKTLISQVATIADTTRKQVLSGDGKLSNCLSTRITVEMAGLLYDNFTIAEAAEAAIYPHFSADGGVDSERTFVKQIVQQFVSIEPEKCSEFFSPDDMNKISQS
jgi:MoxR-like ATPase